MYHRNVLLKTSSLVSAVSEYLPPYESPALEPLNLWQSEAKPSLYSYYAHLWCWVSSPCLYLLSTFRLPCIAHSRPLCIYIYFFLTDLSRKSFGCYCLTMYVQCFIISKALFIGVMSRNLVPSCFLWPQDSYLKRFRPAPCLPASERWSLDSHQISRL